MHPTLVVSLLAVVLSVIAWRSEKSGFVKLGLVVALGGILFDFFLPPYTMCALSPAGTEMAAVERAGLSALAVNTFASKLFVSAAGNANFFVTDMNGSLLMLIFPIMLRLVIMNLVLALKLHGRYWAEHGVRLRAHDSGGPRRQGGHFQGTFALTAATLFTYLLVPLLLFLGTPLLAAKEGG